MATSNHHLLHSMPPWPIPTDRRWRGSANHPAPNCPRCASPQTKFCYYNNYSLSQPRYFCKGCRRYWTKGGSLRNVPVGGGCRKTRRSRSNKSGSSHPGLGPRPTLDSSSSSSESGGPNIDMALVFSNFLNQQDDHKHLIQEEDHQGFISPELATFDHIIEDVFWPDESNLFGSQLQDFDSPLLGDNWSFFDTTGFEAFSKP